MKTFKEFIIERSSDPVELAQRVAKRYGKKTSYGKWLKAEKHGHIPLTSYKQKDLRSLENKDERIREKHYDNDHNKYNNSFERKTIPIKHLHATQPFIRTNDVEKLHAKINDRYPNHIKVIQHKDKHYVVDGHHSVMAAHMRGEKTVDVIHKNLDAYK